MENKPTVKDLAALRKRHELLKRRQELKANYGLLFYKPHPKQDAFHSAADYIARQLETGNRFGKSDCGAAEDCAFALGERPWYKKNDPRRYLGIPRKNNKILIVCADWDKVDEIFSGDGSKGNIGKLWKFLPRNKAKPVGRSSTGAINEIMVESIWGGHSTIHFDTRKSFAVNAMGSESSNWDLIHVDEPITEPHFKAISRGRVDSDGKTIFTCTNLDQPWISDYFRAKPKRKNELHTIEEKGRKSRWVLRGSMYDNPHLSRAAIKEFEDTLTDDEKQCRIHGIPMHLTGLVYKEFSEDKHLLKDIPPNWSSWEEPPRDWTIYVAVDTHPNTPHATLYCAVAPNGDIYFYKERFEAETMDELLAPMKRHLENRNAMWFVLEPGAWVKDPRTKISFADEACKHFPFQKGIKDLKSGILNVKEYLKFRNVYFTPTLVRTLWEIDHYTWGIKDGVCTNKPVDKDDHMMENMYRILLKHPEYTPMEESASHIVEPLSMDLSARNSLATNIDNVNNYLDPTEDEWAYALEDVI